MPVGDFDTMKNWNIEYKVDYEIIIVSEGIKIVECNSIIIEATSTEDVKRLVNNQFSNIAGFKINKIIKLWEY